MTVIDIQIAQARRDASIVEWYAGVVRRPVAACAPVTINATRLDAASKPTRARRRPQPIAIENRYLAQIEAHVRRLHFETLKRMTKALKRSDLDARAKRDSAEEDLLRLLSVVALMERASDGSPFSLDTIGRVARQAAAFADNGVKQQIETVFAVSLGRVPGITPELVESWTDENAKLIKSIETRYLAEVADLTQKAVTEGKSNRWLIKELERRYDVSRSRAKLIATDQIGTLNGQITQARMTSVGIEEYVWLTVGDNRVRPAHQELNNTKRRWDDPHPTEGHPKMTIGCRCDAVPAT